MDRLIPFFKKIPFTELWIYGTLDIMIDYNISIIMNQMIGSLMLLME